MPLLTLSTPFNPLNPFALFTASDACNPFAPFVAFNSFAAYDAYNPFPASDSFNHLAPYVAFNPFDALNHFASTIGRSNTKRFFSLGFIKKEVYTTRPQNLKQLKDRIQVAIQVISNEMLDLFKRSLELILDNGGHHIECKKHYSIKFMLFILYTIWNCV